MIRRHEHPETGVGHENKNSKKDIGSENPKNGPILYLEHVDLRLTNSVHLLRFIKNSEDLANTRGLGRE